MKTKVGAPAGPRKSLKASRKKRELVLVTKAEQKGLSVKTKRKLEKQLALIKKSTFKKHVVSILEMLDNNSEDISVLIHKGSLEMLISAIPIAEQQYRKYPSQSNAYALQSLISQVREILADVKAERDTKQLAANIARDIIVPNYTRMATNLMQNIKEIELGLNGLVRDRDRAKVSDLLRTFMRGVGGYMQDSGNDLAEKVKEAIK